jgi:murein DD-endopeptidase MepM/ murein hydrolase activator NlpD
MKYITKLPFEGIFKVTYPYGILDSRYASGRHDGIDMGSSINPNVYSICNGTISYAGWENINNKKQGVGLYVSI